MDSLKVPAWIAAIALVLIAAKYLFFPDSPCCQAPLPNGPIVMYDTVLVVPGDTVLVVPGDTLAVPAGAAGVAGQRASRDSVMVVPGTSVLLHYRR